METNNARFKRKMYEKFKLFWMLEHGYSLKNLICELDSYIFDTEEKETALEDAFAEWEQDFGFDSEIWPCFDEFLKYEYQNQKLMASLLNLDEFEQYERIKLEEKHNG